MKLSAATVFLALALTALLAVSCTTARSVTPTCEPPCWNGLIPGESTREEVLSVLEQLPALLEEPGGRVAYEGPEGFTLYLYSIGRVTGSYQEGTLEVIRGNFGIYDSVGELVRRHGAPEGVLGLGPTESDVTDRFSCWGWSPSYDEGVATGRILVYPEQGMLFLVQRPLDSEDLICHGMRLFNFCYYSPTSMQELLGDEHLAEMCNLGRDREAMLMDWHGFGSGY
jgi:hypothetical protein